jgi:hypothetical protein
MILESSWESNGNGNQCIYTSSTIDTSETYIVYQKIKFDGFLPILDVSLIYSGLSCKHYEDFGWLPGPDRPKTSKKLGRVRQVEEDVVALQQ